MLERPETTIGLAAPVMVAPPGWAVTLKASTGPAGVPKAMLAPPSTAVATTPVGAAGGGDTNVHVAPAPLLSSEPPMRPIPPSAERATAVPNPPAPISPVPVSFPPGCVQVVPERRNVHAAPCESRSSGPPIRAVLPSDESATS